MSVVNIPTSATGFHGSIVAQAKSAQRVVNSMQITPTLNAKGFVQPLGRITNSASEFQKSMDASAARVFAFGAAVGVINGVSDAFRGLIAATAEVEKSLKDIQVVMEVSNEAMQQFGKGLFDVARNTATSFGTVAESAVELARQGLSAEETLARVNSALILSRLSGLDAVKSTETLTAAINSFNAEGITHEEIVNRMANVDAAFAVSSADMAEAISRAGAVAQSAGVSFNELSAIVTAVQQRTARGGSVIGNGFKSIFTRIKRSGVREALEEIGVATQNNDGTFRSSIAILKDYAQVYKGLSDSQKAYTSEQIAGVFQIQNLQALIQDLSGGYSIYEKALDVANNTTDEATRRNKELNETLSALFSQTGSSAKELASTIGNLGFNDDFKEILKFLNSLAEGINNLLDENQGSTIAKSLVKGISSFLTGPGLVLIGAAFIKIFGLVGKFAKEAFSDLLGINSETKRQQTLQAAIGAMLSQNAGLYQQILATGKNQAAQEKIILNAIQAETAERLKQEAIVKRIAASSRLIGVGASEQGFVPMGKRTSRGVGRKTLNMSSGFIPEIRKEQADIDRGIGGAKKSDKPKVLKIKTQPNKIEKVVANTGEAIVKNYLDSGADAIFNRDMVRQQGLPEGAKKITAAMGYVPNFRKGISQKELENKKHEYSAVELGWSQFGQSVISKYADHYDKFVGTVKVERLDKDLKFFQKTADKIVKGDKSKPNFPPLIHRDDVTDPETGKKYKKYAVNPKSMKLLKRRYGPLLETAPYTGIQTVANNIKNGQYGKNVAKKIPSWTGKRPKEYDPLFAQLNNLLQGVEGEYQSGKYVKNRGFKNVKIVPGSKSFDIEAKDKNNKKIRFESKAVEKQNVVVGLKKAAVEFLRDTVSKQPKENKIGIKDGKPTKINLTGRGALFSGGIKMLTAKDTQLTRSILTAKDTTKLISELKKSGVTQYVDALAGVNSIKTSASTLSKKELNRRLNSFIENDKNEHLLESLNQYVTQTINKQSRKSIEKYIDNANITDLQVLNNSFAEKIAALKRKNKSNDSSINESANSLFPFGVSYLSQGFIPNFIDRRNRAQKIKDVLADPANKNIKFNSPLTQKMSIDTVKKGMGGEFQKMWLESYFKTGRTGDYQMLMKMGYDPDKLKALRKHSEQGGQIDIKTMANGMIPNFAMQRGSLRRYTQKVHTQGIKDPKGKLFYKGDKYKEVKFNAPQAEKDKATWITPSYQTIQGDRNEINEFAKYLETRKDLKPYVVDNFKKEYSKELKIAEEAQQNYWKTYEKIQSGNSGLYERNGFFGRKTMPSEDPLKVQLKYLKKDQIDSLVSDFKKQQKPSFSEGYVPNFAESERTKIKGMGMYSDVSSVVNEKGRTLDVGMIMAGMRDSGASIYKRLLNEIETAAKEGKPYTKINAGSIVGPRIPKALLTAKKLLDKKRLNQNIPLMTLDGMLNPARLFRKVQEHRRVSYNKEKQKSRDSSRYIFGEEASLKKSLRSLGLGPSRDKKDKTTYLSDLWIGKNFVDGYIPSFANLKLWRGQSKDRNKIDSPDISKTMPSFDNAKTPDDVVGIIQGFVKSHVSGPLSGYRDIGDVGNKMPSGATSFSTSETVAKNFAGSITPGQPVTKGQVLSKEVPEKNVFNKKKLLRILSKGSDPSKGYYPKVEEFKKGIKDGSIKDWAEKNEGIYLNVFGRRNDRKLLKFTHMDHGAKRYDFYDRPMNQIVPLKDIGRNSDGTSQISPREAEVMQVMSRGHMPYNRSSGLSRYKQETYVQGIKDPKGKLFYKGDKYREVKFDAPQAERDKASWIKPSYQTIRGSREEVQAFTKFLETKKDLKPYIVREFKKTHQKELEKSLNFEKQYWEGYEKVRSGQAGFYERKGIMGRKTLPADDPLKVEIKYLAKKDIDRLVKEFREHQQNRPFNFAGGFTNKSSIPINLAGGFVPAMNAERRNIARGVGGARSGDKPVKTKIRTSPGRAQSAVVHTGEWIVRNYQGSGADAVFNRNMAKSMGLPAGAKKVTAADGYIPNFAGSGGIMTKKGWLSTAKIARLKDPEGYSVWPSKSDTIKDRVGDKSVKLSEFDQEDRALIKGFKATHGKENLAVKKQDRMDQRNAMPHIDASRTATMLVPTHGKRGRVNTTFKAPMDIIKGSDKDRPTVRMQYRVEGLKPARLKGAENNIRTSVKENLIEQSKIIASNIAGPRFASQNKPITNLANAGSVGAAAGTVFETAIQSIGKNKLFTSNNANFDIGSFPDEKLQKLFGYYTPFADAKIGLTKDTKADFNAKLLKLPDNAKKLADARRMQQQEMSAAMRREHGPATKSGGKVVNLSGGFIPNFARGKITARQADWLRKKGLDEDQIKVIKPNEYREIMKKDINERAQSDARAKARREKAALGYRFPGFKYRSSYEPVVKQQPKVSVETKVQESNKFGKAGVAFSSINAGKINNISNRMSQLESRVKDLELSRSTKNFAQGFIPSFAHARPQTIKRIEEPQSIYKESNDYLDNPTKAYSSIPNFVLPDNRQSKKKWSAAGESNVGFIESTVREGILNGQLKGLIEDNEKGKLKFDGHTIIKPSGEKVSSYDIYRYANDEKVKRYIRDDVNMKISKQTQSSAWDTLKSLVTGKRSQKMDHTDKFLRGASQSPGWTVSNGRAFINASTISDLVSKPGATAGMYNIAPNTVSVENLITQTAMDFSAGQEEQRRFQERRDATGSKSKKPLSNMLSGARYGIGQAIGRVTDLANLSNLGKINIGSKFIEQYGKISSSLSSYIEKYNLGNMTQKQREKYIAIKERVQEKITNLNDKVSRLRVGSTRKRLKEIENKIYTVGGEKGYTYINSHRNMSGESFNNYKSIKDGSTISVAEIEDSNTKTLIQDHERKYQLKKSLIEKEKKQAAFKNRIDSIKKYGSEVVDKSGKIINTTLMAPVELSKKLGSGALKLKDGAVGAFRQIDFQKGVTNTIDTMRDIKSRVSSSAENLKDKTLGVGKAIKGGTSNIIGSAQDGVRSVGQPILTGFVAGIEQANQRSRDFKRQAQAWGIKQIKSARDLVQGGLDLFKVPEGIKDRGNAVTQGFLSFFGTGAPKNKTINNLKEKVSNSSQNIVNFWKESVEKVGTKFNFNDIKNNLSGQFEGLSDRIKSGAKYAGEKTISPLVYGVQRAWEETKQQADKLKEAGIARALEASQLMAFSQGGTDQEKIQNVKERLKSTKGFVTEKFKGLSARKMGINPKSLAGLSLLAIPFAQTGEAPSEQEKLIIPDSKFESKDEAIKNELISNHPRIKALINSEYTKYTEQKTGKKSDTFLEHLSNHKALKGTVTKELEEKYKEDENEPNYLMRQILTALGVLSIGGFAIHMSRKNRIQNEKFNLNNLKVKNDLINAFPSQESSINNKYEQYLKIDEKRKESFQNYLLKDKTFKELGMMDAVKNISQYEKFPAIKNSQGQTKKLKPAEMEKYNLFSEILDQELRNAQKELYSMEVLGKKTDGTPLEFEEVGPKKDPKTGFIDRATGVQSKELEEHKRYIKDLKNAIKQKETFFADSLKESRLRHVIPNRIGSGINKMIPKFMRGRFPRLNFSEGYIPNLARDTNQKANNIEYENFARGFFGLKGRRPAPLMNRPSESKGKSQNLWISKNIFKNKKQKLEDSNNIVYDKTRFRDSKERVLEIKAIQADGATSGAEIFKSLYSHIEKAAAQGKPFTRIDAGQITGPKIPDLIVRAKKILDKKRKSGVDIPTMEITGGFSPQRIWKRSEPGNRGQENWVYGDVGYGVTYSAKDRSRSLKAMREMGVKKFDGPDESFYLQESPMFQKGFSEGLIPNFARMTMVKNRLQQNKMKDTGLPGDPDGIRLKLEKAKKKKDKEKGLKLASETTETPTRFKIIKVKYSRKRSQKDHDTFGKGMGAYNSGASPALSEGLIPNFARMATVAKKRFSKRLSKDEHLEMRQATDAINALGGAKNTHLITPKRDGGTVRKVRDKDDQEAILKYIETRRPFKNAEVEAKALDIWGIKRKTVKDKKEDALSRVNDPFYNPQQADRQFDPIQGVDPLRHGARSGNGLYFAEGLVPNFAPRWKKFKKYNKAKSLKELAKKRKRNKEYDEEFYVKSADAAQKFQRINEKFGIEKIDDVFNILPFSSGVIPNFANPLQAAVSREAAALKARGIAASNIRIEKSASLKSPANPGGLAVTNRIDEPGGVHQGIARAKKMGINPKKHGMAKGFVPNYNRFLIDALTKAGQATKKGGMFALDKFKNMTPEQQSNLSMGAMFMGPMAAEMMMGEDRQSAGMGQRIASGAAMGAGYGAMFGPKGMAIGAAAGAVYGGAEGMIKQDTGDAFKELSEAKKGLDKIMSDTKAISEYGNALSGLDEAMKSGDLTALDEIEASLQESLANIADPELLSGLIELQDNGASAGESLDFVNKKLGELQGQAMALQKAVGASDKLTKRVDDETGFWNSTGNFFGAMTDMAISGVDGFGEFLGVDLVKSTYDERRRESTDLMGKGKQGDVVAKDIAKGYIDSLKEFAKVDQTSILSDLSAGTRSFAGIDTKGKSMEELRQNTVLMAKVRDTAASETSDNYQRMTSGMLEQDGLGNYKVKGEFREQMENTVGGDKNLEILEQQLGESDKFLKAFLEGIDQGGDSLKDLAKISEKGISKAIERENNAAKLQKELQAGYQNMLNMQERIANTISNVQFTDSMNQRDRDFKANFASEGLEFMNANGGMSREDVLTKQNQINQATLKANSSDSLKNELLSILKSSIDPSATFNSDEIAKKYGENIKEAEPRTAEGRAKKGLEDEAQKEQAMLAEKFDTFLQANEDGNLTLEEMTGFLQSIDSEGKVGNGILKQAQIAADRNAKQLSQEMKQASLNMMKQRAVTAAQRLSSMGGSLLNKDDQLQLGNLTAKGAFGGSDAQSMDATLKFINTIGADPSDFGIDKTTAQHTIAMANIDLAERAHRANGGGANFDEVRRKINEDFKAVKEYESKSEQLMKDILGDGGSKVDVDVQMRDILAKIHQDGLNIKNLDGITGALNSVAEQLGNNQPPVENQTPVPPAPSVPAEPYEPPAHLVPDRPPTGFDRPKDYHDTVPEVIPDVTKNKVEPSPGPVVVKKDNYQKKNWDYYGYGFNPGKSIVPNDNVDKIAPTERKSMSPRGAQTFRDSQEKSQQDAQEIVKNEKESSDKVIQKLEDVKASIETTNESENTESLEATISELSSTIEVMKNTQQQIFSNQPEPVERDDSGQQAYENFIAAVDNNTNHLEILSAAVDRVGSEVANLSDVIHAGVGAISAALKNTASSDTNISGEPPNIQDPKSPKPAAISNPNSTPNSIPNPFFRPKDYTPEKQQTPYYEERKREYQEKFPSNVGNRRSKDPFNKPSEPSEPKDYPDTPTTQRRRRSSQPIINNTWVPAAEQLKIQSYEATPFVAPSTYSDPQTFSAPTRPQQNPGYGSMFADKPMNSRPMDMSVMPEFSGSQNYSQSIEAAKSNIESMMKGVVTDKSMNSRPMDMSVMPGFSGPQNYSKSIEVAKSNIERVMGVLGGGTSMGSMLSGSISIGEKPSTESMMGVLGGSTSMGSMLSGSTSIGGKPSTESMMGVMSPISRDVRQFSNFSPSNSFAPPMPRGYGAPSPAPTSQPSYMPTPQGGPNFLPTPAGEPTGDPEAIVTAVNQLKEVFEAKPPAGTEEMQELIGAVNNVEAAYRESMPDGEGGAPPNGGDDKNSIGQITDALKSLPAELKAQLQEVTFSHAITGDVRFNFNTEAMASALGPALTGKLTEMLREPMILDMLAKSLKGRIDKNGLLGN